MLERFLNSEFKRILVGFMNANITKYITAAGYCPEAVSKYITAAGHCPEAVSDKDPTSTKWKVISLLGSNFALAVTQSRACYALFHSKSAAFTSNNIAKII